MFRLGLYQVTEKRMWPNDDVIYLFVYTLFKVDLHITLQWKPVKVNYQN